MSRQITHCGLFVLVTTIVVFAALSIPGLSSAPQVVDVETPPPAAQVQVAGDWQGERQPVTQVTFDRVMDAESLAAALTVSPIVPLDLRWEGRALYLTPREPLAPDTVYRFMLGTTARDLEGTPLDQAYQWGYLAANPVADLVRPLRNGERGTPLRVAFTTPMDPGSVEASLQVDPPLAGELAWNGEHTALTLTPEQPLPSDTIYTVRFDGALRDAAGNVFPPVAPLQFTTPPAVLSAGPQGETVHPSAALEIHFDRVMDLRATEGAVQVTPEVPGRFAWRDTRLIFEPDQGWAPAATYTATVTAAARDRDGHPVLSAPYTWSFRVAARETALDLDAPGASACDAASSVGMDITVRPLLPRRLTVGDRVQIVAVVGNHSPCTRRVHPTLKSDLLAVEGLVTHTLLLAPEEQRLTSWMATADHAGRGEVVAQAISGVDGDVVRAPVTVQPPDAAPYLAAQGTTALVEHVQIQRTYLDAESGQAGDVMPAGQMVQVRLQIELSQAATDLVVQDHLPAGLEALPPETFDGDALQPRDYTYTVGDGGVRFDVPAWDAGRHTLIYLALATYRGTYHVPPAEVYVTHGTTHDAELWGRSPAGVLTIDLIAGGGLAKMLGGGGGGGFDDWLGSCVGGTDNPNDEPYDAVFFEEYGVNPFVDTDEDNRSTFAVDVDTGSYTVMRYYVDDGHLPPDASVRVEEYVNYFDQGYAPPAEGEGAFAIHLEGAPSFYGGERHHLVRVGLQGYLPPAESRPDVVLTFVIDVSGSMNRQNRLELVKDALNLLVDELRPTDRVGIAVYGARGYRLLAHTSLSEADTIRTAIAQLQPEGSTNAAEGLWTGYRMAAEAFDPEAINRVILCSDGVANVGDTGHASIWQQVSGYAGQGIYLTTVGFGMGNYNDVLMEQLADHGDGFYAYVDTLTEAKRLFVYELPSMLQVIARDARVQVEFNPAVVRSYRLIGYENRDVADEAFRDDDLDAGEIGLGHSVTALYEIKFWEDAAMADPALVIYLRYENPDSGETVELNRAISGAEFAGTFEAASARFQLAALVAEYAEVLRHSYWAKGSSLADVLAQARRVATLLIDDPDVVEFLHLVERASTLSAEE
ncbi:MAG: von Willebrand factor type A domain-containing protein [Anaerolineae bacterium]|nr:von Willebrand factor type A domain-containing protein [Anaerolineae bacterium]